MKLTKRLLALLLGLVLAFSLALPALAEEEPPEPDEVPFKVLLHLNRRDQNASAQRFLSLLLIPYTSPQSNYRLQVNRVEINGDGELEVFAEGKYIGDVGLMVIGYRWLVLYVPLQYAKEANGVKLTIVHAPPITE